MNSYRIRQLTIINDRKLEWMQLGHKFDKSTMNGSFEFECISYIKYSATWGDLKYVWKVFFYHVDTLENSCL